MTDVKNHGNSDRPITGCVGDEFEIRPYIEALAEFIKECETPMTVAVQGDWGCGKTSMMNMVRDYLKNDDMKSDIVDIWFNTWQFSQFNMNDTLAVTFLQHLLNELTKNLAHDREIKENVVPKLKSIFKTLAVNVSGLVLGEHAANVVEKIGDEITSKDDLDAAEKIKELKTSLQDIISKVNKRVIVYIDDLDRLQPACAVELLEVLKLFVDCENCVFVMAIDTSVVFQGIREKYGSDMSDAKAQSFFDKMIQLPFKMPVAYYKLDSMIERLLTIIKDDSMFKDPRERKDFISLLKSTANGNPRSLKRLVNSIMLLNKVAIKNGVYGDDCSADKSIKLQILVSLSCLQHRFNSVYDFIVSNVSMNTMSKLCNVITLPDKSNNDRCEILLKDLYNLGMPRHIAEGIDDPAALYELTAFFIHKLKAYYDSKNRESDSSDIYKELMAIISLNNIVDISGPATEGSSQTEIAAAPHYDKSMADESNDIEALASEVKKLIAEGTTESKEEAHRRMWNAGYYYDICPKADYRVYDELKAELSEFYSIENERNHDCDFVLYNSNGEETGKSIHVSSSSNETRLQIYFAKFGCTDKQPLSENVKEFVKWLRDHHAELKQHFGDIGSSRSYISEINEDYSENKLVSYSPIGQSLCFTVFSKQALKRFIEFAISIANDPSIVFEK